METTPRVDVAAVAATENAVVAEAADAVTVEVEDVVTAAVVDAATVEAVDVAAPEAVVGVALPDPLHSTLRTSQAFKDPGLPTRESVVTTVPR